MYEVRSGTFMGAVVLAVGLILSTAIGGWFFVKGKRGDQTITVTGSARKRIKSDLVIWRSAISYQAPVLSEAYRSLSEAVPRVKAYFVSKGIQENQITVSSISSQTLHGRSSDGIETSEITGYSLRQELSVRSEDVEKIGQIAREATELINQGILIESMAPEYLVTKLGERALQIQIAAEQLGPLATPVRSIASAVAVPKNEPASEWSRIKARIRGRIPEIAFANWKCCISAEATRKGAMLWLRSYFTPSRAANAHA